MLYHIFCDLLFYLCGCVFVCIVFVSVGFVFYLVWFMFLEVGHYQWGFFSSTDHRETPTKADKSRPKKNGFYKREARQSILFGEKKKKKHNRKWWPKKNKLECTKIVVSFNAKHAKALWQWKYKLQRNITKNHWQSNEVSKLPNHYTTWSNVLSHNLANWRINLTTSNRQEDVHSCLLFPRTGGPPGLYENNNDAKPSQVPKPSELEKWVGYVSEPKKQPQKERKGRLTRRPKMPK